LSKKHYISIARVLAAHRAGSPEASGVIESIAKELAFVFKLDNSNFDRDRFLQAAKGDA
jgi:hypothetical protein